MAKIINDAETKAVDIEIYLPFMKTLIKKYGNFKMSQELHNLVIYNLCEICDMIETTKRKHND